MQQPPHILRPTVGTHIGARSIIVPPGPEDAIFQRRITGIYTR